MSGTAGLHLALLLVGVGAGDEVLVSDLTFSASVNPILYLGGYPAFIDSDRASWNMDPALLAETIEKRAKSGRLPKAVILVHLYSQSADIDSIKAACDRHGVPLIEDAAEALGATYAPNAECGVRNAARGTGHGAKGEPMRNAESNKCGMRNAEFGINEVRNEERKTSAMGGSVAADLFDKGLCLPSGSQLTEADLERIVGVIRGCWTVGKKQ